MKQIHRLYIECFYDNARVQAILDTFFSQKYYELVSKQIESLNNNVELVRFYQCYVLSTRMNETLRQTLRRAVMEKIDSIGPTVLHNDILANGRPCYFKAEMTEIVVRVKNNQFEYLEDKSSQITVYLFEKSAEFNSLKTHYGIPFKNIVDMHLDGDRLILHLRGAGGHKCYQGDLASILHSLIMKLQAKILS